MAQQTPPTIADTLNDAYDLIERARNMLNGIVNATDGSTAPRAIAVRKWAHQAENLRKSMYDAPDVWFGL